MVTQHFKLKVQPFGVTPDVRFLYLSRTHREAIASLLYGIHACRGFAALIAPPGMGKTTVLLRVLGLVGENARTAFLFQTLCGPEQFLRSLLTDLDIDHEGGDVAQMHAKLNAYLLQESKAGRQVIVVIDEAQNLDDSVLELVRMLSNFETPGRKLMHLILCGQSQLAERLAAERLTQLRQRISIIARLTPFSADETREYIDHRLRVAGASVENSIFSRQAYAMIAAQSGGIPRNVNNLCFNSMSLACAEGKTRVDASMVRETMDDLNLATLIAAKADSVRRTQGPALKASPWLSLSSSLSYSARIAIGLFLALGLLAYNGTSSRKRQIERTEEGVQRQIISEPETPTTSKASVRDDLNDQVVRSATLPRVDAAPLALSSEVSVSVPRTNTIPSRRKNPEIHLLPEDLERLQHASASRPSLNRQDLTKNDAPPKRNRASAESTPQRVKR